jgi:hypothetical protein
MQEAFVVFICNSKEQEWGYKEKVLLVQGFTVFVLRNPIGVWSFSKENEVYRVE